MKFIYVYVIISAIIHLSQESCSSPELATTSTTEQQDTSSSTDSCGFHDGNCGGSCAVRKSECTIVDNYDMYGCGCAYCNYDEGRKQCVGQCKNRVLSKCVNTVESPKSDSDCKCVECGTNRDSLGNPICTGNCSSSLVCKPAFFVYHPSRIPEYYCTCQSPDTPTPLMNECRFRPSVNMCAGTCANGGTCVNDGFAACTCSIGSSSSTDIMNDTTEATDDSTIPDNTT